VAVICHNYGRWLAEAIRSVLAQSLRPIEVLVIDDDSDDNTAEVAASFASQGVTYLRVSNRSAWENRLLAARILNGRWLVCLDADNVLRPEYLTEGVCVGESDPTCGIVRCDLDQFGDQVSRVRLDVEIPVAIRNTVDAGSIYRREAIVQLEPIDAVIDPQQTAEDWLLARRVASNGWTIAHNPVPLGYRRHGNQKHAARLARDRRYFVDAGLAAEPVTIFVPLAGRRHLWSITEAWLNEQTWPREQCRLVLCDNGHDAGFTEAVRSWISECNYPDVRHYVSRIGEGGLAEMPRARQTGNSIRVNQVVASHYNRLSVEASTEYLFILEDDIDPPLDAIESLLLGMDGDVAAVSGAYRHRDGHGWLAWRGGPTSHDLLTDSGEGTEDIDGCGWGCLLVRKSTLSRHRLTSDGPTIFYDVNWSGMVRQSGQRLRINWSVLCDHHAGSL
jgi:glycosyltransferase involved in cell wall biosynthesis